MTEEDFLSFCWIVVRVGFVGVMMFLLYAIRECLLYKP